MPNPYFSGVCFLSLIFYCKSPFNHYWGNNLSWYFIIFQLVLDSPSIVAKRTSQQKTHQLYRCSSEKVDFHCHVIYWRVSEELRSIFATNDHLHFKETCGVFSVVCAGHGQLFTMRSWANTWWSLVFRVKIMKIPWGLPKPCNHLQPFITLDLFLLVMFYWLYHGIHQHQTTIWRVKNLFSF